MPAGQNTSVGCYRIISFTVQCRRHIFYIITIVQCHSYLGKERFVQTFPVGSPSVGSYDRIIHHSIPSGRIHQLTNSFCIYTWKISSGISYGIIDIFHFKCHIHITFLNIKRSKHIRFLMDKAVQIIPGFQFLIRYKMSTDKLFLITL